MNFVLPHQIPMLKPSPQDDSIRRWGLWEVTRSWHECEALMNRITDLMKKKTQSSPDPLPYEAISLQPEAGSYPTMLATLMLDFQPPQLWAVNFCCL